MGGCTDGSKIDGWMHTWMGGWTPSRDPYTLFAAHAFLPACLTDCLPLTCLRSAPYKKRGRIPFGVQRGTYGVTAEEKMRRLWNEWASADQKDPTYEVGQATWGEGAGKGRAGKGKGKGREGKEGGT